MINIDNIKNLEDNWDGYGAKPLSQTFIDKIERLCNRIDCEFPNHGLEIFPTPRGNVQLEWDIYDDCYLEIEIFENGSIELFISRNGDVVEKPISESDIFKMISEFIS